MIKVTGSIRRLILLAFLALALMGIASSLWAIALLNSHEVRLDRLSKDSLPTLVAAYEISRQGESIANAASNLMRTPDKWARDAFTNRIADQFNWIGTQIEVISNLGYDEEKLDQIRKNKQALQRNFADLKLILESIENRTQVPAGEKPQFFQDQLKVTLLQHKSDADLLTYSTAILTKSILGELEGMIAQTQDDILNEIWALAAYALAAVLLAITLVFYLDVHIGRRLIAVQQAMRKVVKGDEIQEISFEGNDEISDMANTLKAFIKDMRAREDRASILTLNAEKANKDKSVFLAAASHDLRQPLQAISLFGMALEQVISSDQEDARAKSLEMVQHIRKSTAALGGLLNSILDITKLEAGVIMPNTSEFDLNEFLEMVLVDFKNIALEKGVDIRRVPCSYTVTSDPILLKQVVDNFVGNAVRYTQEGRVLMGCRRHQDYIRIEIWDTGPGIPDESLEIIFEEFRQLANPARQRQKGFGLGLAIVKRTAALLGHLVKVRSVIGKGSVFSIEVPQSAGHLAEVAESSRLSNDVHENGKHLILVVEDDTQVLEATIHLFRAWGYVAKGASSSQQAVEIAQGLNVRPDLLVLDFQLPGNLTGLDVYHVIEGFWDDQKKKPIPGIIVSGDTHPEHLEQFSKSGLIHMIKPINPERLRKQIETLLS